MKRFLTTSSSTESSSPDNKKHAKTELSPSDYLRVCSYNVDGLDSNTLLDRAGEVCSILLEQQADAFPPDVILLQEVVEATVPVFVSRLASAGYVLSPPSVPESEYFTLAFFNEARITITSATRTPFLLSRMGRDLIEVKGRLAPGTAGTSSSSSSSSSSPPPVDFLFMTSHLESLGPGSALRCRQLTQVLDTLLAFPGPALFAGDTNLREGEVKAEPRYKEVVDAWVAAKSPAAEKVTWDMSLNDNLKMDGASFLPRMRLDRLLLNQKWGSVGTGKGEGGGKEELVKQWKLLGKARMADGRFPSDHFGVSCLVRLPVGGEAEGGKKEGGGEEKKSG